MDGTPRKIPPRGRGPIFTSIRDNGNRDSGGLHSNTTDWKESLRVRCRLLVVRAIKEVTVISSRLEQRSLLVARRPVGDSVIVGGYVRTPFILNPIADEVVGRSSAIHVVHGTQDLMTYYALIVLPLAEVIWY